MLSLIALNFTYTMPIVSISPFSSPCCSPSALPPTPSTHDSYPLMASTPVKISAYFRDRSPSEDGGYASVWGSPSLSANYTAHGPAHGSQVPYVHDMAKYEREEREFFGAAIKSLVNLSCVSNASTLQNPKLIQPQHGTGHPPHLQQMQHDAIAQHQGLLPAHLQQVQLRAVGQYQQDSGLPSNFKQVQHGGIVQHQDSRLSQNLQQMQHGAMAQPQGLLPPHLQQVRLGGVGQYQQDSRVPQQTQLIGGNGNPPPDSSNATTASDVLEMWRNKVSASPHDMLYIRKCDLLRFLNLMESLKEANTSSSKVRQFITPTEFSCLVGSDKAPYSPHSPQWRSIAFCVFCRNNNENHRVYLTHTVKDNCGRVTCPILRSYVCPLCFATGDNAHTIKYCPKSGSNML